MLERYYTWGKGCGKLAQQNADETRLRFLRGSAKEIYHDREVVMHEKLAMGMEHEMRRRRKEAMESGAACYWDYKAKGFYICKEGEWRKRDKKERKQEWDLEKLG